MNCKLLIVFLMSVFSLMSSPFLHVDGVSVPSNDPRIGQHVFVIPGSVWMVWGNDNPPPKFGDRDYNDGVISVRFGQDGSGTADWVGANSAWKNYWTVEGQVVSPTLSAVWGPLNGGKLNIVFRTQDGGKYPTGHQNVLTEQVVPEPTTIGLVMVGLGLIGWRKRRNR